MVSSNRKMLYPYQPGQGYTFTFYIPWSQIYPPPPPLPPPPQQRDLTALFATLVYITAAVLLFTFLTVFLYLYITNSRRRSSPAAVAPTNRREEDENGGERDFSGDHHHFWRIATPGLHRSAIDSIAVFGFKKGEGIIINGTDCSVCLSEFEEDEELRLLPKCSHAFHVNCIDMWLLSHKNCPLCRAPVFSTEPRNQKTETNHHQTESGTNNGDEEESSGLRNANVLLPRSQSDLASRCGGAGGRVETVRRSFSIGGSSLVKDDVGGRSRRQFYSSFSASFFSSSRNQESVLPTRMPSASG